jgi:hypothetical protein
MLKQSTAILLSLVFSATPLVACSKKTPAQRCTESGTEKVSMVWVPEEGTDRPDWNGTCVINTGRAGVKG